MDYWLYQAIMNHPGELIVIILILAGFVIIANLTEK